MLLQAITDGFVIVEREGISVKYPCRPMLIATLNPADSELKDVFLDRIGSLPTTLKKLELAPLYECMYVCVKTGIALNADTEPLTMEER